MNALTEPCRNSSSHVSWDWRCTLCVGFSLLSACHGPTVPERAIDAQGFVDVTDQVQIEFNHNVGPLGTYFMPQIMGSGAAFWDFDLDGRLDILLVDGVVSGESGSAGGLRDRLFRQSADGHFVDITPFSQITGIGFGMGPAVGDVDNDGFADLYVTNFGTDQLWHNNGDGSFSDVTRSSGVSGNRWGTASSLFDYDGDGCLDLFAASYVDYISADLVCEDATGRHGYCGPGSFGGTVSKLYQSRGRSPDAESLLFSDVTVPAGMASRKGKGLGVITRDFTGDHRPDIFVANDMDSNCLWVQTSQQTFQDEAALRGVAYNQFGRADANMGIVCDDLTGDGLFDLFVTHLNGEMNILFAGTPDGQFHDATAGSGLGPPSLPYTGFGVAAVDVEDDGDLDLVVGNGRIKHGPPLAGAALGSYWNDFAEPAQLYLNNGQGRFTEDRIAGGELTRRLEVTRAVVYGDVDNDGDIDLLVTSCGGRARLYLNTFSKQGHWLMVRAIGTRGNRDAFGSQISVNAGKRTFRRDVIACTGYLSSNDVRIHFGIGNSDHYDSIEVQWPDGTPESFDGGAADRHIVLREGTGRRTTAGASE